jgi:glyoxylase-like metal-dependent hydrolase (beta-lactamase superfamily II)
MIEHVTEIVDGIYRVEREVPGLSDIFTVYFIKDSLNVIIDPGPGALTPAIMESAKELGVTDFQYIIPTHVHMDHAGASGKLSSIFKQAKVITNSEGIKHLIDPTRLIRSTKMSFGDDFANTWGSIEPVPESRIKVVHDGEKLSLGGRDLIFFETPGHALHHIAIFDTKSRGLFCGEALGLIYNPDTRPLPAAAPPGFDYEVYLSTMAKLRELPLKYLFYSHGGISREPDKSIITAIANVKEVGEVILKNLKTSPPETASQKIDMYIKERFGVKLGKYSLANNIGGYSGYFKKKGLL